MNDREAAAICMAIGHTPEGILSLTPKKHRFVCSCGYQSANRTSFRYAVEAGIVHMRNTARHAIANGAEIPRSDQAAV